MHTITVLKVTFLLASLLKKMTMNGIIAAVETGERKIKQRPLRNKVAERRGQQNLTIRRKPIPRAIRNRRQSRRIVSSKASNKANR